MLQLLVPRTRRKTPFAGRKARKTRQVSCTGQGLPTDREKLYLRRATLKDRDTILGLITEATEWLRTKDTDQWSRDWSGKDGRTRSDRVKHSLWKRKSWLVVQDNGAPVATVTIEKKANPAVWADSGRVAEPAVYLSRLVTARRYAGQHIGEDLIDWAGSRAAHKYGARWIRIDVWTTNEALHNYYQKRGFEPCGKCPDPNYPSRMLFQKPTAEAGKGHISRFRRMPTARYCQVWARRSRTASTNAHSRHTAHIIPSNPISPSLADSYPEPLLSPYLQADLSSAPSARQTACSDA